MKSAADVVQQFAGSGGEWWLSPASQLEGRVHHLKPLAVNLVITGPDRRELGRWPLSPLTYGSLAGRHAKNLTGEFALPHARNYQYDSYEQTIDLRRQAEHLVEAMAPAINAIQERIYFVDDTAGIDLTAAEKWWVQAKEVVDDSCFWRLRESYKHAGPPTYRQHSSQLAEVLSKAQQGLQLLRDFLLTIPPPTPSEQTDNEVTLGDGSRYQFRHFTGLYADSGAGPVFTSNFQQNRLNEWENVAPFDVDWPVAAELALPTTLRQKLLEIQRLVKEVLQELE